MSEAKENFPYPDADIASVLPDALTRPDAKARTIYPFYPAAEPRRVSTSRLKVGMAASNNRLFLYTR